MSAATIDENSLRALLKMVQEGGGTFCISRTTLTLLDKTKYTWVVGPAWCKNAVVGPARCKNAVVGPVLSRIGVKMQLLDQGKKHSF